MEERRSLGVYIHIPFCVRKCLYCDFCSFPVGDAYKEEHIRRYFTALAEEITAVEPEVSGYSIDSIYIGGGTPTLPKASYIEALLCILYERLDITSDAEFTIECNPGTATYDTLSRYREAGINRLSIGLQSGNDSELATLGRIHSYDDLLRTYEAARRASFDDINIDLMRGIPGQSVGSFHETLERVCALGPEHLSVYSLIIEEGTPFAARYGEADTGDATGTYPALPSEDEEYAMSQDTEAVLAAAGYERYEISNYARDGHRCRHNIRYWERGDYLGLGLGAASLLEDGTLRFHNTTDLDTYIDCISDLDCIREDMEELSERARMEETMFLGLRMVEGVSIAAFAERFGRDIHEVYGDVLERNEREGLITSDGARIRLTPRGMEVANRVMAQFL